MKRTTVKIPDELDARLRHEARRRGATISELTREALERLLLPVPDGEPRGRRRLSAAGSVRSGESDIAERIEEILREDSQRLRS